MKKNFAALIALLTMFQFSGVEAAAIDNEIAILAAEQDTQNETPKKTEEVKKPVKKSKQEIEAEKKRLREEQKAAEKKLKEEQKAARKQIEEGKKEVVKLSDSNRNSRTRRTSTNESSRGEKNPALNNSPNVTPSNSNAVKNSNSTASTSRNNRNSTSNVNSSRVDKNSGSNTSSVGMPNPIKDYANFDEVTKAVGFTPLYIPKKSGYTVTEISVVGERLAQIKYGRRWEPEVSLYIRTYKRQPNEELQDISGINGVKWRVDMTGGTTVYVAKLADDKHAAAWAVGSYTFAAYAENLSFAAFHALVVEELVDLSSHYYTN